MFKYNSTVSIFVMINNEKLIFRRIHKDFIGIIDWMYHSDVSHLNKINISTQIY